MVRLGVERELQIEDAHAEAALARQRLAEAVEHLGHAFGRRCDEQIRLLARADLLAQLAYQHVRLALRALGLAVENFLGELDVAVVRRMPGVGERDAQRGGVLAHGVLVGAKRVLRLVGDVGDQRLVIVEIELRPLRLLGHIEQLQRPLRVARGGRGPGARQRAGQLADGAVARLAELVVRLRVLAVLEAIDAEQQVRHAVFGALGDQLAGQWDCTVPVRLGGFRLEGLLQQHGVAGVEGESAAVEGRGAVVVIRALGKVGGKVAAKQRMRVTFRREVVGSLSSAKAGGEHADGGCH